jgi:hypothetical protein
MNLNRRTAILGIVCASLLKSQAFAELTNDNAFATIQLTIPEGSQFEFKYGNRSIMFSGEEIMKALGAVDVPVQKTTDHGYIPEGCEWSSFQDRLICSD